MRPGAAVINCKAYKPSESHEHPALHHRTAPPLRLPALQKGIPDAPLPLQDKLKTTYYLWQLYHTLRDAEAAQEQLGEQEGLLKEAARQLKATDADLKEKRKVVAGLNKKKLALEQKAKKRKGELEKKVRPLLGGGRPCCSHLQGGVCVKGKVCPWLKIN